MQLTIDIKDYQSAQSKVKTVQLVISCAALAVFVAYGVGGLGGFAIFAATVGLFVGGAVYLSRPRPTFAADRLGFRLHRGRLRLWSEYGGVLVRSKPTFLGEPTRQTVWINVRTSSGFREKRLVTVEGYSYGDEVARKIIAFEGQVQEVLAAETERFDLGAVPVVAARRDATLKALARPAWARVLRRVWPQD